jgi:HD-GYP domain-containing protein (c-di-GMP phosphodiesterase class II)
MAHTRQYGQGMGHDRAVAVLREHAGTQWDADVV